MNREDIIRMAQEAKLLGEFDTAEYIFENGVEVWISGQRGLDALEKFAALVASAEREKYEAIITNMTKLLEAQQNREGVAVDMIAAGIAAEREACAKIAETPIGEYEVVVACGTEPTPSRIPQYANWQDIAKAIRARGQA